MATKRLGLIETIRPIKLREVRVKKAKLEKGKGGRVELVAEISATLIESISTVKR